MGTVALSRAKDVDKPSFLTARRDKVRVVVLSSDRLSWSLNNAPRHN